MNRPIRLLPAFLTVGGWTMLSRVLGLGRDVLMAALLGTGPVAQAFLIAFTLPNMFGRSSAEGAFNLAFVPMFSKRVEADDDPTGFARDAFSGLATILIAFTLIGQLLMPWLVLAMASGFAGDERFDLAVLYGRIAFPYLILISLTALLSGVLNATGRFAEAAAAPILMNVVMIAFLLIGWWTNGDIGLWQIWSVPVAGVAQLALVWRAADRAGMRIRPRMPRLTPELRRLAVIAAPAVLAGGVVQINLLVGRQVGSFFDGAVAWLSYADRLYQLPLGVVGVAIGVVLLPDLSRRLGTGDAQGGRDAVNRAAEFTLALTLPAATALMVIPAAIVSVLFQRGAFEASDTAATALAVAIYGAGLPAFVLQKVVSPVYYAREDTRSPFRFAVHAMIVNAAIALGLAPSSASRPPPGPPRSRAGSCSGSSGAARGTWTAPPPPTPASAAPCPASRWPASPWPPPSGSATGGSRTPSPPPACATPPSPCSSSSAWPPTPPPSSPPAPCACRT